MNTAQIRPIQAEDAEVAARLSTELGQIVGQGDPEITGVALDSRKVRPGMLLSLLNA